jgi:CRISPR-associated protein Csd2
MADQSPAIENRYEFVYLFDVSDGNPNGDPDAGNAPRIDPETGQGLVTDVCLKRKIRNYVQLIQANGELASGYEIYVKERGILAREQRRAYEATGKEPDNQPATVKEARAWMCRTFYDVRTFGAVMSTGKAGDEDAEPKAPKGKDASERKKPVRVQKLWNCGQVRGPIQMSFARSIDPILALEHAITRVALTNQDDTRRGEAIAGDATQEATSGQFGRKSTIPYALYRLHGFVSPSLARETGFTRADLEVFWRALEQMFEHDHSASRGVMSARALIVFEHAGTLGSEPSHKLFERVQCRRQDSKRPARGFSDYIIGVDRSPIEGVTILDRI